MNEGTTPQLQSSVQFLKGVGPKLAKVLTKKGIATLEDALYFLPRAYEDRRKLTPLNRITPGAHVTVLGRVTGSQVVGRGRSARLHVTLRDDHGEIQLTWFHAYPYLKEEFVSGASFVVCGEVRFFGGRATITHPEFEKITEFVAGKPQASFSFGRVVPVYSETEGIPQKTLRKIMAEAIKSSLPHLSEPLPPNMLARLRMPSIRDSFVSVHFPSDLPDETGQNEAISRIIFEEFFVLQLGLGLKKNEARKRLGVAFQSSNEVLSRFIKGLPFKLTGDQERAICAIQNDLCTDEPMARLVQGDVGSGKTVVAFAAAAIAAANGFQTAIMAPTEILAQQHFRAAERWLIPLGFSLRLMSGGSTSKKKRMTTKEKIHEDIVVGTHALFQETVSFEKLGLVVVDEQHRFGVDQRAELLKKAEGFFPHLLMMTATPIPRTLALTLYGDLELTVIAEKPANRIPIRTSILKDRKRLYDKIRETVKRGEQVYIIYPLVEQSEKLELKSATESFEKLRNEIFPDFRCSLLHGRMKSEEKDSVLDSFKRHESDILVSTTVIEVGIDVANATLMVIEHPDRLGLSQLHQLRGRVGRGEKPSECILFCEGFVNPRLRVMASSEDGFQIAEEDLKIRGPGEFLGTRQSGLPGFRVGHILRDSRLLELAREEAQRILESDPQLELTEHRGIRQMVASRWKEKFDRLEGG